MGRGVVGYFNMIDVPLPPPVTTTESPLAEKSFAGLIGAVTSILKNCWYLVRWRQNVKSFEWFRLRQGFQSDTSEVMKNNVIKGEDVPRLPLSVIKAPGQGLYKTSSRGGLYRYRKVRMVRNVQCVRC